MSELCPPPTPYLLAIYFRHCPFFNKLIISTLSAIVRTTPFLVLDISNMYFSINK
jgi:hypothetical protein